MSDSKETGYPLGPRLSDLQERALERDRAFAAAQEASAPKRALALQLVAMRKSRGLTLRELARRAGWSPGFVSRLESAGGSLPELPTILRYVEACDPQIVTGLVFARPQDDHLQVVTGVSLDAEGSARCYFERIREEGLELEEQKESSADSPALTAFQ